VLNGGKRVGQRPGSRTYSSTTTLGQRGHAKWRNIQENEERKEAVNREPVLGEKKPWGPTVVLRKRKGGRMWGKLEKEGTPSGTKKRLKTPMVPKAQGREKSEWGGNMK